MDGLKREYRGKLNVVILSMDDRNGKETAKQHGVVGTPTILLLDSAGNRVSTLRGSFPLSQIEQAVEHLLAQQATINKSGE